MKNLAVIIFTSLFLYSWFPAVAGNSFKPWGADVSIGDERISEKKDLNICKIVHPEKCEYHGKVPIRKKRKVYSAFQGGAYLLIRMFQVLISPQDGPNCKFRPVCSRYGRIAVEKHGAFLGSILAGERLMRCNPFTSPGDDPVPDDLYGD